MDEELVLEKAREKIIQELLIQEKLRKCCKIKPRKELVEINTIEEFKKAISTCRLAIGFFYTPTCPYCRMMEPLMEEAAAILGDRVYFFKVNAARLFELAGALYIMGTPTTIAFHNGREVDRLVGLVPPEVLEEFLANLLEKGQCPIPVAEELD
ncbi:MAG: thioredoxin family protein [Desulfurococcales archaeon]|nr:thioredoxin family protein [Desulfurococcales archaeon]